LNVRYRSSRHDKRTFCFRPIPDLPDERSE
jgi:hypothetical protein